MSEAKAFKTEAQLWSLDVIKRVISNSGDPAETLKRLMAERHPFYAEADVTIHSRDVPHEKMVDEILAALARHLGLADQDRGTAAEPTP